MSVKMKHLPKDLECLVSQVYPYYPHDPRK